MFLRGGRHHHRAVFLGSGWRQGDGGGDPGAVTAGAVDVECAAECLDAVAQAGQATAGSLGCAADAVVGDLEVKGAGRRGGAYVNRCGVRVLLCVAERFGEEVVRRRFDGVVKPRRGQIQESDRKRRA